MHFKILHLYPPCLVFHRFLVMCWYLLYPFHGLFLVYCKTLSHVPALAFSNGKSAVVLYEIEQRISAHTNFTQDGATEHPDGVFIVFIYNIDAAPESSVLVSLLYKFEK